MVLYDIMRHTRYLLSYNLYRYGLVLYKDSV